MQGLDGRDGLPGEPGLDGIPGRSGIDGHPGRDGIPGTPGTHGKAGQNGKNGEKGKKCSIFITSSSQIVQILTPKEGARSGFSDLEFSGQSGFSSDLKCRHTLNLATSKCKLIE